MGRNAAICRQALERDGYRCQITGYGRTPEERELLQVHHWKRLGMGGSDEEDNLDNLITVGPIVHEFELHPGVSIPRKRIIGWNPHDDDNGLIVEERGEDGEWREVPKKELWFYRRHDAEAVEEEIDVLLRIAFTESQRAEIMAHIWANYHLVSDAKSPAQFIAGLGLDPNRARDEATAGAWIKENRLQWTPGVNIRKVLLIRSAGLEDREEMQDWLEAARDMSYSDLRQALDKAGAKPASVRWYLRIRHNMMGPSAVFIRSRNREAVIDSLKPGDKLVEINAFRYGITWDRKTQTLRDRNGREIPYLSDKYLTPKEGGSE